MKKLLTIAAMVLAVTATVNATPGIWLDWEVDSADGSTAIGSVQDQSLNNRDGNYRGEPVFSSDTKTGAGTSLHVNPADDGSNDDVARGGYIDGFGITDWSVENRIYEIDFKLTDEVTWGTQYIFDEYNHDGNYGGVFIRAARQSSTIYQLQIGLRGGSGANTWFCNAANVTVGQWYSIKVVLVDLSGTVGADDVEAYLDGTRLTSGIDASYAGISATGNSSAYRVSIGASNGNSPMSGYVDNFVITTFKPLKWSLIIIH